MEKKKGQIQIAVAITSGIAGLIISVAIPIVWGAGQEKQNAVQDKRLETIEKNYEEIKVTNNALKAGVSALLWKQGINPKDIPNF